MVYSSIVIFDFSRPDFVKKSINFRSNENLDGTTDMMNFFSAIPINFMNLISNKYIAIPISMSNISENILYGTNDWIENITKNNTIEEIHILVTVFKS